MIIKELLQEMSGAVKTLYHYTNLHALDAILDTGYVYTKGYETGTHTERGGRKKQELATIRPSRAKTVDLPSISEGIGGVKIIIRVDILNDLVKGVKAKPIAEFPLYSLEKIGEKLIVNLESKNSIDDYTQKEKVNYGNKVFKVLTKILDLEHKDFQWENFINKQENFKLLISNKIIAELEKELNIKLKSKGIQDKISFAQTFFNFSADILKYSRGREGEERIIVKHGNIPLDKRYMKIELLYGIDKHFFDWSEPESIEAFAKNFEKYKDIFIKNEKYDELKKLVEEKIIK
jgi:hypothetical protein